MKRAMRRHHAERMKTKSRSVASRRGMDAEYANQIADYMQVCSCGFCGCGNPRRTHDERTRAEYKAELSEREQRRAIS